MTKKYEIEVEQLDAAGKHIRWASMGTHGSKTAALIQEGKFKEAYSDKVFRIVDVTD